MKFNLFHKIEFCGNILTTYILFLNITTAIELKRPLFSPLCLNISKKRKKVLSGNRINVSIIFYFPVLFCFFNGFLLFFAFLSKFVFRQHLDLNWIKLCVAKSVTATLNFSVLKRNVVCLSLCKSLCLNLWLVRLTDLNWNANIGYIWKMKVKQKGVEI